MAINLEIGKTYRVRLTSGAWANAKFEGDASIGGYTHHGLGIRRTIRKQTRYLFRNLVSGKAVTIKSTVKIRPCEVQKSRAFRKRH